MARRRAALASRSLKAAVDGETDWSCLGFAAGRAAIGEAGFVGLQFKLLTTVDADTDWERHLLRLSGMTF